MTVFVPVATVMLIILSRVYSCLWDRLDREGGDSPTGSDTHGYGQLGGRREKLTRLGSCRSNRFRQNAFSHVRNCTRISSRATNRDALLAERHEEPGCPFMSQ